MVLPRLIKLSPVYSGLTNYLFEWDNAEIRTSKETADLVNILASNFEVDSEWVSQQTGVPILGLKTQLTANTVDQKATDDLKKKAK